MTLALIDTFGFFFRSYYAMPKLTSPDGFPTGLLTGFLNFINSLVKSNEADYVLFCLEGRGEGFREKLYPDYKGQRPDAPDEFKMQLPIAIEWLTQMGFASISVDGYEADDVIATAAKIAKIQGLKVQIITHDKDLYQLIDDENITIWDPTKKTHVGSAECFERFGVYPKNFIDFQALLGDSVDNVPGVRGIGLKTAAKLIQDYDSLENIYASSHNPKITSLLEDGKHNAFLSKQLVSLQSNVFESLDLDALRVPQGDIFGKIVEDLRRFSIKGILKRREIVAATKKDIGFNAILLDDMQTLKEVISKIPNNAVVAFDTETDSLDTKSANLVGFSFAFDESYGYYVPIAHSYLGVGKQISKPDAAFAIKELFKRRIVAHNYKFDGAVVSLFLGEPLQDAYFDTMIGAWLLNPGEQVGLDYLAKKHFEYHMIAYIDAVRKGDNFSNVQIEEACKYSAEDAWMTYKMYLEIAPKLDGLEKEFFETEMPFIKVLNKMEDAGIKVDLGALEKLKYEVSKITDEKKANIYDIAGVEFNVNSTKQLQNVLFDKLGLVGAKKTKLGFSTDEATLDKLKHEHPIINAILEYRAYFKLYSTYIMPLLELGAKNKNHRVFSSFLQTGTATGRLSSKNPNLQNIPVRGILAKELRSCFVANESKKLISIDYSQIELRLLAHFSKDPTLVDAFLNAKDIHLQTAEKIFGASEAHAKRDFAKTINFGLIYGMGAQKLSETLEIELKEARGLIESYFAGFPTVKSFLDKIKADAKHKGFVQTLLGRKRYFMFDNASTRELAMFEREAANTVFQGSAADLIKLAMLKIDEVIDAQKLPAQMILQIHDELIFEASEADVQKTADIFSDIMQTVYPLSIPLIATPEIGDNWGEI